MLNIYGSKMKEAEEHIRDLIRTEWFLCSIEQSRQRFEAKTC